MKLNLLLKMLPIGMILVLELTTKSKPYEKALFRVFLQILELYFKNEPRKEMADMKHWQVNHDDTAGIIANVDNLKEENKDLTNRSMRSTLIFRGVPESAK